ncbi:putative tubulin polyglutamylase ttll2 [Clonorchis sinensis]|uniref:Tubulin polyglutamylase ttll2 n=1 Tax=Clonorchis sinensis TaxID=79923 RepID=A0A8T1MAL7_CLOSI|nr:putative tubulin polyglutamylase ttll2 [Clonorchis sinensis]
MYITSLKLKPTQRVNHHPPPTGTQGDITKKDGLLRAVRRMCATYPKCAPLLLLPTSFHLPREESQFIAAFLQGVRPTRTKPTKVEACGENSEQHIYADCFSNPTQQVPCEIKPSPNIWILKPADQARGKGIYLFNQLEHFAYFAKSVVQKYITDPLLIQGYKFDLRLYAVVPSYAPFIVYIYSEGLVRFATEPFDLSDLQNVYSHLTNSSINVNGPRYLLNKKGIGRGSKWTLKQLHQWMTAHNLNTRYLWARVKALILLTLLSQASSVPKAPNAYELFGFDILIDNHLRPWLLEVNANPSMSGTCIVDELVKKPLITSLLSMLRLSRRSPEPFSSNSFSKHESQLKDVHTNSGNIHPIIEQTAAQRNSASSSQPSFSFKHCSTESKCKLPIRVTQIQNHAPGNNALESALQKNEELDGSLASPIGIHSDKEASSHPSDSCRSQRQLPDTHQVLIGRPYQMGKGNAYARCPLYGSGSEWLFPQLRALGDQFKHVHELHKNSSLRTFSKDMLTEPNGIAGIQGKRKAPKAIGEYCHPTFHSYSTYSKLCITSNSTPKEEEEQHQQPGNELIPHAFGLMRLAFPFNLSTRIACASGRGGYPDVRSCVQQICRLMVHYSREERDKSVVTDISVMDIPDVWAEVC